MLHCPAFGSHLITIIITFLAPCCGDSLLQVIASSMALYFGEADAVGAPGTNTLFKNISHVPIGGFCSKHRRRGGGDMKSSVNELLSS